MHKPLHARARTRLLGSAELDFGLHLCMAELRNPWSIADRTRILRRPPLEACFGLRPLSHVSRECVSLSDPSSQFARDTTWRTWRLTTLSLPRQQPSHASRAVQVAEFSVAQGVISDAAADADADACTDRRSDSGSIRSNLLSSKLEC